MKKEGGYRNISIFKYIIRRTIPVFSERRKYRLSALIRTGLLVYIKILFDLITIAK